MTRQFLERPILNSPYEFPGRHWTLDGSRQPSGEIVEWRRRAAFLTPIPKPRKRKPRPTQREMVFDEGLGLSSKIQQYGPTPLISYSRIRLDRWRKIPNPNDWQVTPETTRLLQRWRHYRFASFRPFFGQVEAAEALIWRGGCAEPLAYDLEWREQTFPH